MLKKAIISSLLIIFFFFFDLALGFSVRSSDLGESSPQIDHQVTTISNELVNTENFEYFERTVNRFIRYWGVSGASVAVSYMGKLVYARGFGFANIEDSVEMQPYHLLRIASVSKLITAVAVMKLVEDGKLSLNQKVFGENGILNNSIYRNYIDPRVEDITVKQLLNHSGGWTTQWGDHLFMSQSIARQLNKELPITKDDIITFTLGKRLHFNPGMRSSYTNIGYLILERVIEKVVKTNYESYVNNAVFKPIGIFDAFIAYNYDDQRYPYEVRYYEVPEAVQVPSFDGRVDQVLKSRGGNDVRTLGAAGGWVISSVSLMKFISSIDLYSGNTLLSKRSIRLLTQKEPGFQPLGWRWVSSNRSKWRTGSFAGTSALAISQANGFTYVFLTNTSPWVGARFPYEVNRMMTRAIGGVKDWPEFNYFSPYRINFENYVEINVEELPFGHRTNYWSISWFHQLS